MSTDTQADDGSSIDAETDLRTKRVSVTIEARGPAQRTETIEDGEVTSQMPTETVQHPPTPERIKRIVARPIYNNRVNDYDPDMIAAAVRELFSQSDQIEPVPDGDQWRIDVSIPIAVYHMVADDIAGGGAGPPNICDAYCVLAQSPITDLGPALAWLDAIEGGSPFCGASSPLGVRGGIPEGLHEPLEEAGLKAYAEDQLED